MPDRGNMETKRTDKYLQDEENVFKDQVAGALTRRLSDGQSRPSVLDGDIVGQM
jgi:hypothetical protein